MKNIIFAILIVAAFSTVASAQSGTGSIRGFVVGSIHNGSSLGQVNVTLRAIENHSHTGSLETRVTDGDGFYEIEVSFGYYLLTISAQGYETYQTKVFIPSSRRLEWGTLLEKSDKGPDQKKPVAQEKTIPELTAEIAKTPSKAELYLQRGDAYYKLWEEDHTSANLSAVARATADYSKYLSFKPQDIRVAIKRFEARDSLFLGTNPFTLADLIKLAPRDDLSKSELKYYRQDWTRFRDSPACIENRKTAGFQGHAGDTPMTKLAEYLDPEMLETAGSDGSEALKAMACGADVNHIDRAGMAELAGFNYFRIEHLVALLEAGAKADNRNARGETVLMQTFALAARRSTKIDDAFLDRLALVLEYGADVNAKSKTGTSVLAYARTTKSAELISFLKARGTK